MRLILGSGSPRRRDLLAVLGLTPDAVLPPEIDETPHAGELPRPYCARVAREKALATVSDADDVVLCADTTVALGRRILGKPENRDEADAFLTLLSGRRHRVYTAVSVRRGETVWERLVESRVRMKTLSVNERQAYLATGDWQGKAGGYSIQGPAGAFIPWISGSHSAIVGLPLAETAALLATAGYPVWDVAMKGRVVLLDELAGRKVAALWVDGRLEDLLVDPPEGAAAMPGAIYRARVLRPVKGQGGLFVDLGDQRGFLRQAKGLAPGQDLLVQVSGTSEEGKAAPVTLRPLFKSRYAIVTPDAPGLNISRSIKDEDERDRLLEIAHAEMASAADGHGLILRSAAEGVSEAALAEDIAAMRDLASAVMQDSVGPPECLLDAPDAHALAWRDWANPDPDAVISTPGCLAEHGLLEAIDAMLSAMIRLPAGAHAWIEPTRALVAVDVNSGADTSLAAGLKANLALCRALPRALRIKGFGGQIVLDLAPMPKKDRRTVEQSLRRAVREDGAEFVLAGWTPLGHFELTRKLDRLPLSEIWPG